MKRFKVSLAVLAIVVAVGASAFTNKATKAVGDFYGVTNKVGSVYTFANSGNPITFDETVIGQTRCTGTSSTVCIVRQTSTAPAYFEQILGGFY